MTQSNSIWAIIIAITSFLYLLLFHNGWSSRSFLINNNTHSLGIRNYLQYVAFRKPQFYYRVTPFIPWQSEAVRYSTLKRNFIQKVKSRLNVLSSSIWCLIITRCETHTGRFSILEITYSPRAICQGAPFRSGLILLITFISPTLNAILLTQPY